MPQDLARFNVAPADMDLARAEMSSKVTQAGVAIGMIVVNLVQPGAVHKPHTEPQLFDLRTVIVRGTSRNVVAQTRTGDLGRVVMIGAHLDSVPEGPGIVDNGSGDDLAGSDRELERVAPVRAVEDTAILELAGVVNADRVS